MQICTAHWPKGLRSSTRQHYSGTIATNGMGPVVLPDISSLWHVSWLVQKDVYGKHCLIPVGGEAPGEDDTGSEADEPGRATPPPQARNAGTSEPTVWHSMPVLVWQEAPFDFKVGAIVDLAPADGPLGDGGVARPHPIRCLGVHPEACRSIAAQASVLCDPKGDPRG